MLLPNSSSALSGGTLYTVLWTGGTSHCHPSKDHFPGLPTLPHTLSTQPRGWGSSVHLGDTCSTLYYPCQDSFLRGGVSFFLPLHISSTSPSISYALHNLLSPSLFPISFLLLSPYLLSLSSLFTLLPFFSLFFLSVEHAHLHKL